MDNMDKWVDIVITCVIATVLIMLIVRVSNCAASKHDDRIRCLEKGNSTYECCMIIGGDEVVCKELK